MTIRTSRKHCETGLLFTLAVLTLTTTGIAKNTSLL